MYAFSEHMFSAVFLNLPKKYFLNYTVGEITELLLFPVHVHPADFPGIQQGGRCIGRYGTDFEQPVVMTVLRHEIDTVLQITHFRLQVYQKDSLF